MYLQPVSLSQMVKSRAVKKADIDLLEGPFVNFFAVFNSKVDWIAIKSKGKRGSDFLGKTRKLIFFNTKLVHC